MGIFVTKEEREARRLADEKHRKKREEKYAKIAEENKLRLEEEERIKSMNEIDHLSNYSEKQLLVAILKTNRKTSGWITFIGWVVLIGIIFNIIMALGLLSL
tara:strand:+ start:1714 stop:2019 length:306 start_codon:yes stop_codon:yes gene_type:complete